MIICSFGKKCQVALDTMGPRGYENNDYQKVDLNGNTCVFSLGVLSSTPCVQCTYHFAPFIVHQNSVLTCGWKVEIAVLQIFVK